jgi:hypothetical protein
VCACVDSKLKKDLLHELTDSSTSGIALSIVAALVMIGLVVAELSSYMTLATDSRIVLDHFESSSDDTLQVNFNFSFPHLKCEYSSVDATNFMGTHDAGLAARVNKVRLDKLGRAISRHQDRKTELKHTVDEPEHTGPFKAFDLKEADFEVKHHEYDVMLVNFFAPWCHW